MNCKNYVDDFDKGVEALKEHNQKIDNDFYDRLKDWDLPTQQYFKKNHKPKKLGYIAARTLAISNLQNSSNFHAIYEIQKSKDFTENEKKKIIENNVNLRIQFYKNRINARHKGEKFSDFLSDTEIVLNGIKFGKFENIEKNIYYCLDGIDFALNGHILLHLIYTIPTLHDKVKMKQIYKNLAPYKTINTDILRQYNNQKIPLSDYEANTALLYALMSERNKTAKGINAKGYKYRDCIISLIQEFIYCNFLLFYDYRTHHLTLDNKQQNIYTNLFVQKLILNIFLPNRVVKANFPNFL